MVVGAMMPADVANSDAALRRSVAVPRGFGEPLAWFLSFDWLLLFGARLGALLGRLLGRPIRLGKTVLVARHADCVEMLGRDLDYLIGPVNGPSVHQINGPFVLSIDRGALLDTERRALYAAFKAVDLGALDAAASAHADALLDAAGEGLIDAVGGYARLVAGGTAHRLFGIAPPDEGLFLDVTRSIFHHCFVNPAVNRRIEARAVNAGRLMHSWFVDEITRRRDTGALGCDYMGGLLRDATIDDDAVRRLLGGMLVGSIDPTASALARIAIVMARDPALRAAALPDVRDRTKMLGWCQEAMRRWPNNPVVLRRAGGDSMLGKTHIPAGANIIGWTQAAMYDAAAFPDPARMAAGRPMAAYLHFGGGPHPCGGRLINYWQLPLLAGKLLERGFTRAGRLRWVGPFPDHLPIRLGGARP